MAKAKKKVIPKKDTNQLAKSIVDIATGERDNREGKKATKVPTKTGAATEK